MEVGHEPDNTEPVDHLVFQRMLLQEIKVMMDEIDKRLFEIFVMVHLESCKKNDIAMKFHISRKLVRQLIDDMNEIIQQIRKSQE